jgi:autotransporter translocation and assembly factor TamB
MEGTMIRDKQKDTLLYAGQLRVRITDWFFLKPKTELKYIGLEDAVIKLNRKDSLWNYQFIADYFASPTPTKKKKSSFVLDLKKIDLKNIRFIQNDFWTGNLTSLQIESLALDAENINLKNNSFSISSIILNKPMVILQSIKPLRTNPIIALKKVIKDTGLYFNTAGLDLKIASLQIINGGLFIEGNTKKADKGFDGSHIELSRLNGTINKLQFQKDTLTALINLSVKDRSGFELKKLKTNFKLTPQIMELAQLDLQTNKSRLGNYYAMKYSDFNKDFGNYIEKVVMNAKFINSKIHSDDIAYFAPELKSWKKEATISGNFIGTVANFKVNNLRTTIGATTTVSGSLTMKGLPYIDKTFIGFNNGTISTNSFDLGLFIPNIKDFTNPDLAALGQILFRGNFNGTTNNFKTAGIISSKLGGLTTNISLKLPKNSEPVYTGYIQSNQFNIGKFIGIAELGMINFKGDITGSSFKLDKLKTKFDGVISSVEYNNYTYTNIVTNGTIQKMYFNGELKISDPNIAFTSNVEIDYSKELPLFNIVGDLSKLNLKDLNFVKEKLEVVGLLDVNFTGKNIDQFTGTAKLLNAIVKSQRSEVRFDSLNITSTYIDSIKKLHVGSNDFNSTITGKFKILDLPASFQAFLYNYFPAYIKPLKETPKNQQFNFSINTQYFEPYVKLFDKSISGFNDASIKGSIDTKSNLLSTEAYIPYARYQKNSIVGLSLIGKGNFDSLVVTTNINSVEIGDSLKFPNSIINVSSSNNHSIVAIKTRTLNKQNSAELFADVYTLEDGVRIKFRQSSFVLNEKEWNIEKLGELEFRKNQIIANNIAFTQGFQEISIEQGEDANGTKNKTSLNINLRNVILGDITSMFIKDQRLEGVASGTVKLTNIINNITANADIQVDEFRLDKDSIGLVKINAGYNNQTGLIPFKVTSPNEGYNFSAEGSYNIKDTTGKSFTTTIDLKKSQIGIVEQFLSSLFTNLKGEATGNLTISGDLNSPNLLGTIKLINGGMKVNYTQVYYTIDSATIKFEEDGIDFGKFAIKDKYKNTGIVSGKLFEHQFKNMAFDFDLSTEKLLLLDTKAIDNEQFYGKAIGKASLSFKGPEYGCKMTIVAESNDSSYIVLPNSTSKESGAADFIVFKQYGIEMTENKTNSNFNLLVDLDIIVNNNVAIDVVLDELTGDIIKAVGNGRLRIKAGTTEPLTIKGRYNIEKGSYDFSFQSLLKKPFELLPNAGNFIEWNGDPFEAELHIDAQYTAERVSVSDLIGNNSFSGSVKGYRGDVYVIASLRNQLSKPDIKFKLDFPQYSPIKNDNDFAAFLARIERDENEMLKQVSFLIVFGSFAPTGQAGGNTSGVNPYSLSSIGFNSLSQLLTKEVNKAVSGLLYKLTKDKSLRFDMGTTVYSSSSFIGNNTSEVQATSNRLDRSRVNLKLGKAFYNNNIIVTFGGDLDFNLGASSSVQSGNLQWLPDVTIEFVLTTDRKLRAIVFSKNSLDISGSSFGRINRQGVSISYRQDFEKLFGTKKEVIKIPVPIKDSIK